MYVMYAIQNLHNADDNLCIKHMLIFYEKIYTMQFKNFWDRQPSS